MQLISQNTINQNEFVLDLKSINSKRERSRSRVESDIQYFMAALYSFHYLLFLLCGHVQ